MNVRRKCAEEIQSALHQGGLMNIEALAELTGIPKRNLRQSIGILRKNGIVDMLPGDHQKFFYQLSQALPVRKRVARTLGCEPEDLVKPLLRRQDWYHNQWCELWSISLKRAFPEVEIIREHAIGSDELAKHLLQINKTDDDLLPDFLAVFPKTATTERVAVAFEIERTRKSNARLMRKFKKYLKETKIDGLVYVCDSGRLSETIRTIYETMLLTKASRIEHYADHFFLFSNALSAGPNPLETFHNVNGNQVSLIDWCNKLRMTTRDFRRDSQFENT